MNITGIASEHCQGVVTDAASAQLAPLDEARKINYWPRRIAKIEEALSNARALRRAARMQLVQADTRIESFLKDPRPAADNLHGNRTPC